MISTSAINPLGTGNSGRNNPTSCCDINCKKKLTAILPNENQTAFLHCHQLQASSTWQSPKVRLNTFRAFSYHDGQPHFNWGWIEPQTMKPDIWDSQRSCSMLPVRSQDSSSEVKTNFSRFNNMYIAERDGMESTVKSRDGIAFLDCFFRVSTSHQRERAKIFLTNSPW